MILILDDHPLSRQGLVLVIQTHMAEETVLEAGTVREAIAAVKNDPISAVFVDLNLGRESGFDFISWLKENTCGIKCCVISSSSRPGDFRHAREMGVDAYILKDSFVDEIIYGLKMIERGRKFYSSALVETLSGSSEEERALQSLTEREMDVFSLLCQGMSNAQISQELFISPTTTKKHISSILGKLGLQRRVECVLFANRTGIVC